MRLLLATIFFLALVSCHDPERFVDPRSDTGGDAPSLSENGTLFPVNTDRQICNPSISQDTEDFPASMLWLGFSGQLTVSTPIPDGYTVSQVRQHDRLTISDSANRVEWFVTFADVPGVECEFQDPEWSTHALYLATMGGVPDGATCDDGQVYNSIVVRTSDKASLLLGKKTLDWASTPHLWVEASAGPGGEADAPVYSADGWVDTASIRDFFGTRQVRSTFSKVEDGFTLYYIDWSKADPGPVRLSKPSGRESSKAESGLISPDGKWVAYNLYDGASDYSAYVQELRPGSVPVLFLEGASDPHWWVDPAHPQNLFVVYTLLPAGKNYVLTEDLRDKSLSDGSAGNTWIQQVELTPGAAASLALRKVGEPLPLANLPMRGGLSPDGRWLATGTNYGYLLELP